MASDAAAVILDAGEVVVRSARCGDMHQLMQMIHDLAVYENVPDGPRITAEDLIRDGFESDPPHFFALVAESKTLNRLVGYAVCHHAYSSWVARSMYIEDFYVEPQLRGHRLGHRIFKEICKMAVEQNCHQIDWHVLAANEVAIKFYERHGAYDLCKAEDRTAYRMKRDKIVAAANSEE